MSTVSSGQTQYASSGQRISATIVLSGGTEYVSSGGTADATIVSGGVELTAHLIQAMASFNPGPGGHGALFESVSGGVLHIDSGMLAPEHHPLTHPV